MYSAEQTTREASVHYQLLWCIMHGIWWTPFDNSSGTSSSYCSILINWPEVKCALIPLQTVSLLPWKLHLNNREIEARSTSHPLAAAVYSQTIINRHRPHWHQRMLLLLPMLLVPQLLVSQLESMLVLAVRPIILPFISFDGKYNEDWRGIYRRWPVSHCPSPKPSDDPKRKPVDQEKSVLKTHLRVEERNRIPCMVDNSLLFNWYASMCVTGMYACECIYVLDYKNNYT